MERDGGYCSAKGQREQGRGERYKPELARLRIDFDVVEGGEFVAVGDAFDADFRAALDGEVRNAAASRRIAADFCCGQWETCRPFVDGLVVHENAITGFAVVLIEVLDAEFIHA